MNKLIKIPHGNTVSIGAVDACLQATNPESGAPFNSRHVLMQLAISEQSRKDSQEIGSNRNQSIPIEDIVNAMQGSITV